MLLGEGEEEWESGRMPQFGSLALKQGLCFRLHARGAWWGHGLTHLSRAEPLPVCTNHCHLWFFGRKLRSCVEMVLQRWSLASVTVPELSCGILSTESVLNPPLSYFHPAGFHLSTQTPPAQHLGLTPWDSCLLTLSSSFSKDFPGHLRGSCFSALSLGQTPHLT